MSVALDKYNDRTKFEIPRSIKIKKLRQMLSCALKPYSLTLFHALGEIAYKVKPSMSKDDVLRGLRMMVVRSREKEEEQLRKYDYCF